MGLFEQLTEKVKGKGKRIVFPEGLDERVLTAAGRLAEDGVLTPVVIGNKQEVEQKAADLNVKVSGLEIIDPANYEGFQEMVDAFVERRKGKQRKKMRRKFF